MDCARSVITHHSNLEVHKVVGRPKERKTVTIAGVSPPVVFATHNNSIVALERAVLERVFHVKRNGEHVAPFKPLGSNHYFRALCSFTAAIQHHLPSTVPISPREFVDRYSGRKRLVYEQALASLDVDPLKREDSFVKVFVKFEKFNYTLKPDAVPRVVSPRSPRFNVMLGRYIVPIEERIFKSIGEVYGMKTVMKGMNASESGRLMFDKWNHYTHPVALGLDAERFDQHVSREALQYEHSIYKSCFWRKQDLKMLTWLLNQQLDNQCSGNAPDGWLKYNTSGVRMSGDMNTSLGNCVLMCAMIYSYGLSCGVDIQLANNGDDCVVFMESCDLQRFTTGMHQWFIDMGFSMVAEEPVYEFEQIQFCQTQPVWVGPEWCDYIMVRDPRVAISKDATALLPLSSPREVAGWLDAVGQGGISLTGGIPIWQDFYSMYARSAVGPKSKIETGWGWGVRALGKSVARCYTSPAAKTRYSFWLAFGISPEEQEIIEQHYRGMAISLVVQENVPMHVVLPF